MESPRPVPLPTSLVVKKGSKIFSARTGGMPLPGVAHFADDLVPVTTGS